MAKPPFERPLQGDQDPEGEPNTIVRPKPNQKDYEVLGSIPEKPL